MKLSYEAAFTLKPVILNCQPIKDLLDRIVAPEVVHHITLGSEAFTTVLRAVKRPVIVMHPHVDRKIVAIIEALLAIGLWAKELCSRLMVRQVCL